MNFERFEDLPEHERAAMSEAQRNYYRTILNGPKLGHGYVTAHRQAEVRIGSNERRQFFAGYFFDEALRTFENFAEIHCRQDPTTGLHSESTVSNRISHHYPGLFPLLRARLSAMFELPQLAAERIRFELLEEMFYADLAATEHLSRKLEGIERKKKLHNDYRLSFLNILDDLRSLLHDLVAYGEMMQERGR